MALGTTLPTNGFRLIMIAMTPKGRLYFDTWRAHEGRPAYKLTGWGKDIYYTRQEAAIVLRGVPEDRRMLHPWAGITFGRRSIARTV